MAMLLDRTKRWRRKSWEKGVFLEWNHPYQKWVVIGLAIIPKTLLEQFLNCDDLEEYQPEPEKKKLRVWVYRDEIRLSENDPSKFTSYPWTDITKKLAEVLREELEK